jgi:enamine deaminase RidA (YjgF/YER057c/UK114 family)
MIDSMCCLLVTVCMLLLQSCEVNTAIIRSPLVYDTTQLGFAQAVISDHLILGSGQVGWNSQFELTGDKGFKAQFNQSLDNISNLLVSEKSNWQKVLQLRFYIIDMDEEKRKSIGEFLRNTYQSDYCPATTIVGVQSLGREELLVEIEFIAQK